MDYLVQQLLNALAFGAEYALIALGLALVYSIMNLMNFAHGEIIAAAGYAMYLAIALGIGSPWLVAPIAVAAGAAGRGAARAGRLSPGAPRAHDDRAC